MSNERFSQFVNKIYEKTFKKLFKWFHISWEDRVRTHFEDFDSKVH